MPDKDLILEVDSEFKPEQRFKGGTSFKPFRFFLAKGEEDLKITFLSSTKKFPGCYEHTVFTTNQVFPTFAVCLGEKCPLCDAGNVARFVRGFTILQETARNSKGEIRKNVKKILILNDKDWARVQKLTQMKRFGGDLMGRSYEVSRTAQGSAPPTGDSWIAAGEEDLKDLEKQGVDIKPLSGSDIFNVMTAEQMNELIPLIKVIGKKPEKETKKQPDKIFTVEAEDSEDLHDEEIPF